MPYANEHAARLKNPDDFDPDSFRRTKGGTLYGSIKVPETIGIIWGKLKGAAAPSDPPLPQALRFPTKDWSVDEAKTWLRDNKIKYISFEPAEEPRQDIGTLKSSGAEIERRVVRFAELRLAGEANAPAIDGYAAVFNSPSEDMGFTEIIEQGFFENVLEDDTRALFNHDSNFVLGRTKSRTLTVAEDEKGLSIHITPPATALINDMVLEPIRRGDVDQMSFSFMTAKGGDEWLIKDEHVFRTLKKGGCQRLFDVSPVTFPAYPETSVSVRSKFQELQGQIQPLPGGEEPVEKQAQARLDMLRRRLELAEKS